MGWDGIRKKKKGKERRGEEGKKSEYISKCILNYI